MIGIDILVIMLMCITITYAYRLNRRMAEFYRNKKSLTKIFAQLDKNVKTITDGLTEIKLRCQEIQKIESRMAKSSKLLDELEILTAKGDQVAGRIDRSINTASKLVEQIGNQAIYEDEMPAPTPKYPIAKPQIISSQHCIPYTQQNSRKETEHKTKTNNNTIESLLAKIAEVRIKKQEAVE
jgi:uncharacterized phage infection (PIP) family protein YhgE